MRDGGTLACLTLGALKGLAVLVLPQGDPLLLGAQVPAAITSLGGGFFVGVGGFCCLVVQFTGIQRVATFRSWKQWAGRGQHFVTSWHWEGEGTRTHCWSQWATSQMPAKGGEVISTPRFR
jgi:hypothetical protein